MKRLGAILLLIAAGFTFAGCATTDESTSTTSSDVSSIPWNRPESWEGKGPLGGMGMGTQ